MLLDFNRDFEPDALFGFFKPPLQLHLTESRLSALFVNGEREVEVIEINLSTNSSQTSTTKKDLPVSQSS